MHRTAKADSTGLPEKLIDFLKQARFPDCQRNCPTERTRSAVDLPPSMRDRRTRVLEVLYSFGIGGSEVVGLELAKALAERGMEVLCAALNPTPGPLRERAAEYGLRIVDLGISTRNIFGRNGLSVALVKRLADLRLDAIHLQHFLGLNKLGLPARLAGVKRVVVTEHSVFDASQTAAGRFRIRLNWRLTDAITVVHKGIKDYLCSDLHIPQSRIEVIPVGIDVDRYQRRDREASRRRLNLQDELVYVFVGRLAKVKNVPGLIAAFLAVQSRGAPLARLFVIGDGEEAAECRAMVSSHPLGSRVALVGEQPDPRAYLAAADIFVLNSSSEGTPRALLEAMATGLPSICPAVGNIPEMIGGRGWLTRAGDQASLESMLDLTLRNVDLVRKASDGCRPYVVANYGAAPIVDKYFALLTSGT